jgi:hypothetical protein
MPVPEPSIPNFVSLSYDDPVDLSSPANPFDLSSSAGSFGFSSAGSFDTSVVDPSHAVGMGWVIPLKNRLLFRNHDGGADPSDFHRQIPNNKDRSKNGGYTEPFECGGVLCKILEGT